MKALKGCLKTLGLILFYLFFSSIPLVILELMGISYDNLSMMEQIFFMLFCDVVVLGTIVFLYRKTLITDFKNFFNKNILSNLENSFKYWFLGFIVMFVSNLILAFLNKGGISNNEEAVREMIELVPLYMAFNVSIYAPFIEELIFRKSIREITDNKWLYVLLSGFIFGGLHVVASISNVIDLLYIIPYSSLGIAFAYSYYKSNNIYSTISMHVMHNTVSFFIISMFGYIW